VLQQAKFRDAGQQTDPPILLHCFKSNKQTTECLQGLWFPRLEAAPDRTLDRIRSHPAARAHTRWLFDDSVYATVSSGELSYGSELDNSSQFLFDKLMALQLVKLKIKIDVQFKS
jgi:hypothetical protein